MTYAGSDIEHRATDRFPIESALRYKLRLSKTTPTGAGRTVNMSSAGILFTTETRLPAGERVELFVDWPARLNDNCALTLVAFGKIVRSELQSAAIRIEKYDFRTRAVAASTAPAGSTL